MNEIMNGLEQLMNNIKPTVVPFSWNDNLSEEAIDWFDGIRPRLSYCSCQSIGMALAKLEMIEKLIEEGKINIDLDKESDNETN